MRKLVLVAASVSALALGACTGMSQQQQATVSGGAIGAGVGAVGAGLTGGSPMTGAVLGGAVGAGAGYLSEEMRKNR